MAQQNFITSGTLPTGPGGAALSGAELTLLGHAVNRFAAAGSAAYVTDDSATMASSLAGVDLDGNVLSFPSGLSINPTADVTYNIINKVVLLQGPITMGNNNGNHLNFINCNIYIDAETGNNAWILGCSNSLTDNRARSVRISDGATNTSTVSLYGSILVNTRFDYTGGFGQNSVQVADCIFSDMISGGSYGGSFGASWTIGRANGARYHVVNIDSKAGISGIAAYGNMELFSGVELDNYSWSTNTDGNADRSPSLLDRPNYNNDDQTNNFYNFNSSPGNDTVRQNAAVQTIAGPVLESADIAWGVLNGATGSGIITTNGAANRNQAGITNYWGHDSRYFEDAQLTVPVQGVKLRVTSTVDDSTISAGSATITDNTWSDGGFGAGTGGTVICDYVTNANGIMSSDSYILGTAAAANGYVNWINWRTFSDQGVTVLGNNTADNRTPAGLVLAPIEQTWPLNYTSNAAGSKGYNRYPITYETRSFTHDVHVAEQTVPTYTAGQNQATDELNTVATSLVGETVKASNVAADNSPSITWSIGDTPSINDVRDRFRGGWYDFDYDLADGNHLGPVVLTLAAVGGTNYEAAAGSISAACSGIALDGTTDLFTEDTFASINFNGGSCAGHNLTALTNITNLGAINNSRLEGTSIEFPTATATRTNSTLVFNTLAGRIDLATFTSGMIYGRRSGTDAATIRFDNIADGSTINTNQLLGTDWSVVTPGEIQLIATATNAFTVTVTQYDVDNLVIETAPGVALTPGNTVTTDFITYVFPEESYDVRPAGTIDEIRARGGYFQIRHAGTDVLAITPITNTTMLTDITVQKGASNTDSWVAYYKPATSWGSDRTAYNFTIDTIGQISENYQVQPIEIADVLVANSETDPGNNLSASYTQGGTKLFIHIDAAGNSLNSAESQAVSLEAANSLAYFNVHVAGQRTTQLFEPGINNGSTWLTATDVQFESGKTNDAQQIVSQVTGGLPGGALLTPDASGYNEVININEVAASIPSIQEAVAGSIDPVNTTLAEVKGNHAVLLRATQRGAVKSATYSAGELNT